MKSINAVSEKTPPFPQEFFTIIFPVNHQEDHQQNHLLDQKAEMPGSTRAAEGPTDKAVKEPAAREAEEPAAREAEEPATRAAEGPTARAVEEPTTKTRLH